MKILFVAGFAPIVPNPTEGASFYRDTLGLPLQVVSGDYIAVDGFDGSKHLGVWPLADAAQSCFGTTEWPAHIPIPQEHQKVAQLLDEIISVIQSEDLLGEALFKKPFKVDDCGWVSNRLAELLPISLLQKNHLLAQTNPRIRLDLISEIIEDDDLRSLMMH